MKTKYTKTAVADTIVKENARMRTEKGADHAFSLAAAYLWHANGRFLSARDDDACVDLTTIPERRRRARRHAAEGLDVAAHCIAKVDDNVADAFDNIRVTRDALLVIHQYITDSFAARNAKRARLRGQRPVWGPVRWEPVKWNLGF